MKRRDPEQLNMPTASKEPEYDLEDILREFGGETASAKPVTDDTVAFRPIRIKEKDPRLDEPMKVVGPSGTAPVLYREDPPAPPRKEAVPLKKEPAPPKKEPAPPAPIPIKKEPTQAEKAAKKAQAEKAHTEKPQKQPEKRKPAIAPAPPPPDPLEQYRKLRGSVGLQHLRLWPAAALCILNTFLLIYEAFEWNFLPLKPLALTVTAIALLGLCLFLCFEVVTQGVLELIRLHPSHNTLGLLAAGLAIADAVMTGTVGYCGVASALILCLFRGLTAEQRGRLHTLRTVCAFEHPVGVYTVSKLVKQSDSLRRDAASTEDFMLRLETTDLPRRLLRLYSTVVLLAAPAVAYLAAGYGQISFIRCWMLLLLGAVPFSCGLCYSRPFSALARRLRRIGGALCGWYSATVFRGQHTLVLRDEDLFPRKHIVPSGMKLYGSYSPALVIGYALAALKTVDNPLTGKFEALLQEQHGRRFSADSYRCYDTDGLGAEVNGEVVLVGSLSFMRSMGVHMPDGTKVRQAVYVSVGGELAGIFAFKYKPAASTRAGLLHVLSKRHIRVILATRDFLITPELIAAKYELNADSMVFPAYGERLRLSGAAPEQSAEQGALIAGDSFGAFAATAASGRLLRSASLLALWLCLLAGVFGFLLCALLILWDSAATASPLHLGVFHLLWTVLTSFVTFVMLRP